VALLISQEGRSFNSCVQSEATGVCSEANAHVLLCLSLCIQTHFNSTLAWVDYPFFFAERGPLGILILTRTPVMVSFCLRVNHCSTATAYVL